MIESAAQAVIAAVLGLAAFIGAVAVIWRFVEALRRRWEQQRHERLEVLLIRTLRPMTEEVAVIEERTRELMPNGGESIADKVTRIEFLFLNHSELSEADRAALHSLVDDLTARVEVLEEEGDQ